MKATPWNIAKLLAELTDMGVDEAYGVVIGIIKKKYNSKGKRYLSLKQPKEDEIDDNSDGKYDSTEWDEERGKYR